MVELDMDIARPRYLAELEAAIRRAPVTALLGARQVGKSTLARALAAERGAAYFDLESPRDRQRLETPELSLGELSGLVVIDEIQLLPELLAQLRVLVDRPENAAQFLVLGSAAPGLVRGASESLAGRVEFVDLAGLDLSEVGAAGWRQLWLRGGFPRSYLAASEADSLAWRESFIRTFLERDIPQLGFTMPSVAMRRFWTMLAHRHGQTWNAAELARSLGVSDKTVRQYLDLLTGTYMVRQLQPWFENLDKRQVRAPKVYLRDSGLLHRLLDLPDEAALLGHAKAGSSWEGFALEQAMTVLHPFQAYFWGTHQGAELDLMILHRGRRVGIEFKLADAPRPTRSMYIAMADLSLEQIVVLYPGPSRHALAPGITAWPLAELAELPLALDAA
jgi:predicted AAA+ superfamily ATPase